ncbi:unnamed protein product [Litomosoides sigmodontis]|uniref:Uncharacterized protein n=1 Tax=Litomosoides sigmodontis TaxID=42156 RepID=A0A3P6TFU3_LITSI|nr:unnamed protein product [Litomosoides sigmodontis]
MADVSIAEEQGESSSLSSSTRTIGLPVSVQQPPRGNVINSSQAAAAPAHTYPCTHIRPHTCDAHTHTPHIQAILFTRINSDKRDTRMLQLQTDR